jgi:hypothetical protein
MKKDRYHKHHIKTKNFIRIIGTAFLVAASAAFISNTADAKSNYTTDFNNYYGTDGTNGGTTLGSCITCHVNPDGKGGENPYATIWKAYGRNFAAVEPLDSDGDGFSNIDEIIADTWPGDASSTPGPIAQPPVANAGGEIIVNEEDLVILDGSGSYDPDGFIVSYSWSQITGVPVTLSATSVAQPTFTAPFIGSGTEVLTFRLTVTDNNGLQANATAVVNVDWVNDPPVADAGTAQTVSEGIEVTLDGSNSNDPDNNIVSYSWLQTGGPSITLSDSTAVKPTFTSPTIASTGLALTFDLTVSDGLGLAATDTAIVNVTRGNLPPVADAGGTQTVNEGVLVTLNGSASNDPDGTIVSFQWFQQTGTGVALSNPSAAQPTFTALNVGPGGESMSFQLTVTDDGGLQAVDTSIVNVFWINEPPTADTGADQTGAYAVEEGSTVTLNGSASSDPDDGIASYLWEQTGGGTTVTLSDPNAAKPTFVTPIVDATAITLNFRLTVTDKGGLQATDQVAVEIFDNGITGFPSDVLTARSSEGEAIGISEDNGGNITKFQPVDPTTLPAVAGQPENMIIGLVDLQINTATIGDTSQVTIHLTSPAPPDYKWYKFNPLTRTWTDYSNTFVNGVNGAVFNATRDQVTLTLVDGGPGDDGGLLDGKILDPSGLGTSSSVSPPPSGAGATGSNTFGSSGGSGCFIDVSGGDRRPVTHRFPAALVLAATLATLFSTWAMIWFLKPLRHSRKISTPLKDSLQKG